MPRTLHDDLVGVVDALRDNAASTRQEMYQVLGDSHAWNDDQYRACQDRLSTLAADFVRLLERKRQLEREIKRAKMS